MDFEILTKDFLSSIATLREIAFLLGMMAFGRADL
jgi:hypothetical protein